MKKLFNHINLLSNGKYTLPYCNCLLIQDEINCLVDSSPTDEDMLDLRQTRIDLIVNSHGHSDHCSRNYEFTNAKVLLHPQEHERVISGDAYLRAYGFNLFPDEAVRPFYLDRASYHPRAADGELIDGQIIATGKIEFRVIHLPGHSIGHSGFVFSREGFIFTADIHLDIPPFYAMLDSSVDDFISSIDKLISLQPDTLVGGHGKAMMTKNVLRRLERYKNIIFNREEKILNRVKSGKTTIREIALEGIAFGGKFPKPWNTYYLHECVMDWKHLQRLERLGEIICINGKYYPE